MQNESWTKEMKLFQVNAEDEELNFILNERSDLLLQLKTVAVDPSSILNLSASDDTESSEEEFDSSKVIKTENLEPDVNIKEECHDDEYQTADNFNLNIKQEIVEENIVCEEVYNGDMNMECDTVIKQEIDAEEFRETIYETNNTEYTNEDINNEGDQIEPKIEETTSVNSCCSDTLSPNYFDIANSSCLDTTPSYLDTTTYLETVANCLDTNTCLNTVLTSGLNTASGLETDIGLNSSGGLETTNSGCLDTVNINELNKVNVKEKENSYTDEPINKQHIEEIPSTSGYEPISTQIESNNPIEIKKEPVEYDDDFTEDNMIDSIRRELRPRKLNETVYFEQYIGSSSDESDFTLSD